MSKSLVALCSAALLALSVSSVSAQSLEEVCPDISNFSRGVLYKHPGSPHLPSSERDTLTFIFKKGDSRAPNTRSVSVYDSQGNRVARLGRKFPDYFGGKRFYTIPTGDKRKAQRVQKLAKDNTGSIVTYFKVRGTCLRAPRLVNTRLGGL